MIVVFDLDDTLYEEITYVKSAFKAVANYLEKSHALNAEEVYAELLEVLNEKGRGSVFNNVLSKCVIFSKAEVNRCLSVYRKSEPEIQLTKEALRCLERFEHLPKYVVTDGNKMVQTAKIKALKLDQYFEKAIPTHNYGLKHSKPSTYVFHKILEWEKMQAGDLVYIGDNPNKDFVNLKKEGFKTVRVRTGMFKDVRLERDYEAHYEINSLDEFDFKLLTEIFK